MKGVVCYRGGSEFLLRGQQNGKLVKMCVSLLKSDLPCNLLRYTVLSFHPWVNSQFTYFVLGLAISSIGCGLWLSALAALSASPATDRALVFSEAPLATPGGRPGRSDVSSSSGLGVLVSPALGLSAVICQSQLGSSCLFRGRNMEGLKPSPVVIDVAYTLTSR